jgi:hypothetical protein
MSKAHLATAVFRGGALFGALALVLWTGASFSVDAPAAGPSLHEQCRRPAPP